jgi:hypothetical protein
MIFEKLLQPLIDRIRGIESQASYLKMSNLYRESREFQIRFSQCIGEAISLVEIEMNRLTRLMVNDMAKIFPVVLDRFTIEHKSGGSMEYKFVHPEVKSVDPRQLILEHFISTEERDRGGDLLKSDGVKVQGRIVVLMAHGYSSMGVEPIARCLNLRQAETKKNIKGILARTQFFDDSVGRRLFEKATQGFMPNWSIGWLPLKWEDRRGPRGEDWRDVHEWELLEYSPVGVPMNPSARYYDENEKRHQEFFVKSLGLENVHPLPGRLTNSDDIKRFVTDLTRQMVHEQFQALREKVK